MTIKYLITFLFVFFIFSAQAQTTYFDQNWEETTKEKASYFRHITPPTPPDTLIRVQDFYISGAPQMDGYVTTLKYHDNFVGRVNWYFPNGQLEHYTTFHPETLKKFGPSAWYLKNGELLAKGTYEYGSAYDGIVRNYTYALRFTKAEDDQLISRLDFYDNSHQISHEQFYYADAFRIKKDVYYDKSGKEIGRLKYLDEPGMQIDSGIKIEFYRTEYTDLAVKTIQHYQNQKANGEQITYHPNGQIWTKGINKDHKHFDGEFIDYQEYMLVKNGTVIKTIQYDNKWKEIATLQYKNNEIWEGKQLGVVAADIYKNGKHTERINYFTPQKKIIKSRKIYGDKTDKIEWFDKSGQKLGTGIYKEYDIWDGLNIQYSMNTTLFSHYKNGVKEGLEKLFDEKNILLSEKTYHEGQVIKDKTRNPLTGKMIECKYKDGRAFNGSFFEYDDESIFKNGKLIQKNKYTLENKKYRLAQSIFYDPNNDNQITKQIIFEGDSTYTLFHKDGQKYNGVDKTRYQKITYTNGEQTGPFEYYREDKISIKGTLKDGLKHGNITFYHKNKTYHCKYNNGTPVSGTEVRQNYGDLSITEYKNKKRHGKRIYKYNDYTRTENYKNGLLTEEVSWKLENGASFSCTLKDGQPYNGDYYDPEFNIAESYINGKKHGLHKSNFGAFAILSEVFDKGIKTWEQVGYAISDTLFNDGEYKNGKPYNGTFAKRIATDYHYFTPYKNGKKAGKEILCQIYAPIKTYGYTHYINDKKEGEYLLTAPDFLPKGIKEAKGIYKNNQPYSGTFITNEQFKILSTYKNGLKDGLEIADDQFTDTIHYTLGKPMDGIQIEAYNNQNKYFSHRYLKGLKTSSIYHFSLTHSSIVYTQDGFDIRQNGEWFLYDFSQYKFTNKKHTKGSIEFFTNSKSIGKFYFRNGLIYKGKIAFDDFTIYPKGKYLIADIHSPAQTKIIKNRYQLPEKITYQNFMVLDDIILQLFKDK